jgi:hypothetical protein
MQSSKLAPQARPHALANLEVAIARAEEDRDRHRLAAERASGDDDSRRAKAFLRIAEEHLAQLHRSREVLLHGERNDVEAEAST